MIPYAAFGFPPRALLPIAIALLTLGVGVATSRPHRVTCARSASEVVVVCEATRATGRDRFWLEEDERLVLGEGKRAGCLDKRAAGGGVAPVTCAVDEPAVVAREVTAYAAGKGAVYVHEGSRQGRVLGAFVAVAGLFGLLAGAMIARRRARFTIHLSRRDNSLVVEHEGPKKATRLELEGDERVEIESMPPPAADATFSESAPRRLVLVTSRGERRAITPFLAATAEHVRVAVALEQALHDGHHGEAHDDHHVLVPGAR